MPTSSTSPSFVAAVGGRPIPLARIEERLAEIRRGPRGRHLPPDVGAEATLLRRWLVQQLVGEAVMAHEARALGFAPASDGPDDEFDVSRESARALFEHVTRDIRIPEAESRAFHDRNADRFRSREVRRLRHVMADDEATARALGREMAADGTVGGAWTLRRGEFTGPLEDAVFDALPGALIGPVASELGWHACLLISIEPERVVPYEEARPEIEEQLLEAVRTRAFGEWLEGRRAALAVIEPAWEHPAHPVHGLPRHRH